MCKKSPSVTYVCKKVKTTRKSVLLEQLKDYPLTDTEYNLLCDAIAGLSITELSDRYNKSPSRISQCKREICEKIHAFDIANLKR